MHLSYPGTGTRPSARDLPLALPRWQRLGRADRRGYWLATSLICLPWVAATAFGFIGGRAIPDAAPSTGSPTSTGTALRLTKAAAQRLASIIAQGSGGTASSAAGGMDGWTCR